MAGSTTPRVEPLWARLDELYDAHELRDIPPSIQPELFHYTTVEGLKGIVESGKLWATSAYHLNDSSEIEYGCQIVADSIDEWLKANAGRAAGAVPLLVLDLLKRSFAEPSSLAGRHVSIYISCFCENGNLLSQWRAYGQRGGYSIGMVASDLEIGLSAPGFFATRLQKVTYNREKQRAKIHSILHDFISVVENESLYTVPTEREALKKLMGELGMFLQELVMDKIVAFKNPAFAEEREWRIVARPRLIEMQRARERPDHTEQAAQEGAGTDIQYRHSNGALVPYLELSPLTGGQLPIYSLRFGPSLDKIRTEYALLGFLLKHRYNRIRVFGSDMPVIL